MLRFSDKMYIITYFMIFSSHFLIFWLNKLALKSLLLVGQVVELPYRSNTDTDQYVVAHEGVCALFGRSKINVW